MGRLRPNRTPGYQVERGAGRSSLGVRQSGLVQSPERPACRRGLTFGYRHPEAGPTSARGGPPETPSPTVR
jgi:hypothetical protein